MCVVIMNVRSVNEVSQTVVTGNRQRRRAMNEIKVLDLFSGIGGFSLGLERAGPFRTIAFCEREPFCQAVLKKHWPEIPIFDDIKKLGGSEPAFADGVDLICGGFP
jgi:DNA (cytosine-5)-methyltransferase 1